MWQKKIVRLLSERLRDVKGRNPSFSLRNLAKRIGISSGALSEIMSGRRAVSPLTARKVLRALAVPEEIAKDIERAIDADVKGTRQPLPAEAQAFMGRWHHFAILSLLELAHPPRTAEEIAARLDLPIAEIQKALQNLIEYKFLRIDEAGGAYVPCETYWSMGDGGGSAVVAAAHKDGLAVAMKAVDQISFDRRDLTASTFSASARNLEAARKEVRRFHARIAKLMSAGEADAVFRLNVQLFPLDQWERKK